jgi:hypothetical protein
MLPETFLVPTNSYLAFMSAPNHTGICGDFLSACYCPLAAVP